MIFISVLHLVLFFSGWAQTGPTTAVSIDEIRKFGITTNGYEACNKLSKIPIYKEPETQVMIDSVAPGLLVKYGRLSEIRKTPYWAPRRQYQLPEGEKFKIYTDSLSGWVKANNLMTFSSGWREQQLERFLKRDINTVACIYSSGQFETASCSALTIWERTWPENLWVLRELQLQPIDIWLYTFPQIDTLVRLDTESLAIQLSVRGGDAEDRWGNYVFYLYQDNQLLKAYEQKYRYAMYEKYTTLECKLTREGNQPVVVFFEKHFKIDSTHKAIHLETDTTKVNLFQKLKYEKKTRKTQQ